MRKKIYVYLLTLLILPFGYGQKPITTIAVMPFENLTGSPAFDWLREGIAEVVSGKISANEQVAVVERSQLTKVLEELKLSASGLVIKEAQIRAGRMLGAKFLLLGSFQYSKPQIMINARIIDTETAQILSAVDAIGTETEIFALQKQLVQKILQNIVPSQIIAKIKVPLFPYEEQSDLSIFRNLEKARIIAKPLINSFDLDPLRSRDAAKYLQGISYVEKITSVIPNHSEASLYAGLFYLQIDDTTQAESYLKYAINANPNYALGYFHLGNLYRLQRKKDIAFKYFNNAINSDETYAEAHFGKALLGNTSTQPLGVIRNVVKALYYKPYFPKAEFFLKSIVRGTLAGLNGERYLEDFLSANPDHAEANFALGYLYAEAGNLSGTYPYFKKCLNKYPLMSKALYHAGKYQLQQRKTAEAKQYFSKSLERYPFFPEANLELAQICEDDGEYAEALLHYERFMAFSQDAILFPQVRDKISSLISIVGPTTIGIVIEEPIYKQPVPEKETIKAKPELTFKATLRDENSDGICNGGEKIKIDVDINNVGDGEAVNISVVLSGESSLLQYISNTIPAGNINPHSAKKFSFETILPNQIPSERNVSVIVSVKEGRGYDALKKHKFMIAMAPAETVIEEEKTYVDVDIVPSKQLSLDNVYAIIIGISKYRESNIPEVKYARRDAEKVKEYLENLAAVKPINFFTLYDERAAMADFMDVIEDKLTKKIKPNSTLYIYYAGHGTPGEQGDAFLVPYDGRLGAEKTLYPLKRMYEVVNDLPIKQAIIILDACFTGEGRSVLAMGKRPLVLAKVAPAKVQKLKFVVLAAAKENQTSNDYDKVKHGLFTYYFLCGLRGDADVNNNNWIELGELYKYVKEKVSETARTQLYCDQEPTILPEGILKEKANLRVGKVK